ncbi:MAG: hypothetical protein JXQ90_03225 [Cyclobacteriaceae bacterium]
MIQLSEVSSNQELNELNRLKDRLVDYKIDFLADHQDSCYPGYTSGLLLLDTQSFIRGHYLYSIDEIDRAIVECDLLLTLLYDE